MKAGETVRQSKGRGAVRQSKGRGSSEARVGEQ